MKHKLAAILLAATIGVTSISVPGVSISAEEQTQTGETSESASLPDQNILLLDGDTDTKELYISSLSAQLFYGAEKDTDGTCVWNASDYNSGHRFSYRINFALSGAETAAAGSVKLTIPKSILTDRDGNAADTVEFSIPSRADVDAATDENGNINTSKIDSDASYAYYEDGDSYVIYNFRDVSAAENSYIELSYVTSRTTYSYVDNAPQKDFTCSMTIGDGTGANQTKSTDPIPLRINTGVTLSSVSETLAGTRQKTWNDAWGTAVKPADPDKYYYLVWCVHSNVNATQPYNFTIDDSIAGNYDGMTVLGYRFAGQGAFGTDNTVMETTDSGDRYDYVLTAIPLDTYRDKTKWAADNTAKVTVTPFNLADDAVNKDATTDWEWEAPAYKTPEGHFNVYKTGDDAYRRYGQNVFSDTTHSADTAGFQADEYSRSDLEKFDGYNSADKSLTEYGPFDFASWVVGYPYEWTRDTANIDPDKPWDSYGKENVRYELTDDGLFLANTETALLNRNGSSARTIEDGSLDSTHAIKLASSDYSIKRVQYSWYMRNAEYDSEETGEWITKAPVYTDKDILTFYGRFDGSDSWVEIGTYNIRTGTASPVSDYVKSMTENELVPADGRNMTAYRISTENAHYFTELYSVPYITLRNSDAVMKLMDGQEHLVLVNNNHGIVSAQDKDKAEDASGRWYTVFDGTASAADYAIASQKKSSVRRARLAPQHSSAVSAVVTGDFELLKKASDTGKPIDGVTFRITGTSDYGTAVDKAAVTDSDGILSFEDLERGTYTLQETKSADGYLLDRTGHKVVIDNTGKVTFDGTDVTGKQAVITNKLRIHADVKLVKTDSVSATAKLGGAVYSLSGTSDYGTAVLVTETSQPDKLKNGEANKEAGYITFSDIEKGTYQLKEVKAPDGYSLDENTYTVKIDETGAASVERTASAGKTAQKVSMDASDRYIITDELLHQIVFTNKSSYDKSVMGGSTFTLTGTSDAGTAVTKTAVSDADTGTVLFSDVKSGTYLLQETKVPDGYETDTEKYAAILNADGSYTISGLTKTGDVYDFYNNRKTDKQIVVTKVWDDGITTHGPKELVVTIQTEVPPASIKTYQIAFDANGGSGTMASVEADSGKPYTLPANTFTNEGYRFAGWNTKADGSGTSFADGASVTDIGAAGTTATLYAQWKFITQTITDSRTLTIQTPGWYTITAYGAKGGDAAGRRGSESDVAKATGGSGGMVQMRVYLAKGNVIYTENGQHGGSALTSNDEPGGNGGARSAVAINGSTVMIAGGGGGAVSGGGIGYYGYNQLPALNGGDGGILCNVSNDSDHTGAADGQSETAFVYTGWHNVGGGGGGYYGGNAGGRYREENYGSYLSEYEGFKYITPGHNGNGHLTILGYEGYARYRDGLASTFDQNYGTFELHQQGNYNLPKIGTGRWYYLFSNINVDNIAWKYQTGRGAGDGDSSYSGAPQAVLNINPIAGYTRRNDLGIWVYHNDVTWPIEYVSSDKRYEFADDAYAPFNYYASTVNMTRKSYSSFGGTSWYNSGYSINGQTASFSSQGGVNTNQYSYVVVAADNGVSSAKAAVRRSAARLLKKSSAAETKESSVLKEQFVDSSGEVILRQNEACDYTPWIVEKSMKVSDLLPEDVYVEEMKKTIHVSHGIPDISGYVFDHMEIGGEKVQAVSPGTYTDESGIVHSYSDGAIARCVYRKK